MEEAHNSVIATWARFNPKLFADRQITYLTPNIALGTFKAQIKGIRIAVCGCLSIELNGDSWHNELLVERGSECKENPYACTKVGVPIWKLFLVEELPVDEVGRLLNGEDLSEPRANSTTD